MLLVGCSPTSQPLASPDDARASPDAVLDARAAEPADAPADAPASERPPADAAPADAPGIDAAGIEVPDPVDAPTGATCECTAPPRCLDAVTLEISIATTACIDDACGIATSTSVCPFGCTAGACRAEACVPSCPAAACGSDGCGGSCGACDPGTTYPGARPVELGTAGALVAAGDGLHVATVRQLEPPCAGQPASIGRMDVWTVPLTGAASHRTIGAHVLQPQIVFSQAGDLLYLDNAACDGHGELWIAHGDGSGARRIAANVGAFQVAGTTVVYESRSDSSLYAAQLPLGVPVKLLTGGSKFLDQLTFEIAPDGGAVWAYTTAVTELRLARTDGSASTTLVAPPDQPAGAPMWSPDGRHLAFRWSDAPTFAVPFDVVNRDGTGRVQLSPTGSPNPYFSGVFAPDGRLAYIEPASTNFDVVVRSFTGAPSVRISAVGAQQSPGVISALQFSVDGTRLYAGVDDSSKRVANLMVGATSASGGAQLFNAGGGGWSEAPDGSAVAVAGAYSTSSTSVVALSGPTVTLPGAPLYVPVYEPVATRPRLLVSSGTGLSAYAAPGSAAGSPLGGFMATSDLNGWVNARNVPFVFGWARSLALYPAAVHTTAGQVSFDLMGWSSDAARGRLLAGASRYQVRSSTGRIFATTDAGRLFVVPVP